MKSIGFVISNKNNEQRRALLPEDLVHIAHYRRLFFETGYGATLGCRDKDYCEYGVHIVSREEALKSKAFNRGY